MGIAGVVIGAFLSIAGLAQVSPAGDGNVLAAATLEFLGAGRAPEDAGASAGPLESLLGPGTAVRLSPDEVWRESPLAMEFVVTIGKEGLSADDAIGMVNGSYIDRWKFGFPSDWWGQEPPWQVDDPAAPNHVTAACSRRGVTLSLKVGESGGKKPYCNQPGHFVRSLRERMRYVLEIAPSADLEEGDTVTVRWENATAPSYAARYFFLPFLFSRLPEHDFELPNRQGRFDDLPWVRVRGRDAVRLHVACSPLVGVGESFALTIAAVDEHGNPAEDFEGTVRLTGDAAVELPKRVRFAKRDQGHRRVEGIRIEAAEWYRISASCEDLSGQSNYVVASADPPAQRLYFGDMHTHTLDCDGTVEVREHFRYAPNVAGLDFGAVSCHAEYFGCKEAWDRYVAATTQANQPGRFVTFYGYEWANDGHTNAYFLSPEETTLIYGPRLVRNRPEDAPAFRTPCTTEGDFMRMLRGHEHPVFCIAHCHTKYGEEVDDGVLWLDEIYSCHQRDRKEREQRLRDNLARGLRLGVVAGSDMHRLTMGHLCKEPGVRWPQGGWEICQYQTGGLQATFATELTRRALYDGMKARRTYGTSGARIVLLFRCGDHPLGSDVALKTGEQPEFQIDVGGTAPLAEVVLCRYDGSAWSETTHVVPGGSDRWSETCADTDFSGPSIYYVRVLQKDGENAWSSPIWVSVG